MTEQDKIESRKLFNGIAVIIDDEIAKEDSGIVEIAKQLDEQQIPTLKLSEIPPQPEEFAQNLYGVSILIVDWKFNPLSSADKASGVTLTDTLTAKAESEVIAFIKAVLEKTYCPVFIFSQENTEHINERLREAGLLTDEKKQVRLLIKSKSALLGGKLFSEINEWTDSNLPIYVLKVWEEAARKSKLAMFADLESKHHSWPKVIWDTSRSDHTDPSDELSKTLTNIFANRIAFNCQFEKEQFSGSNGEIPLEDMRAVLEAERYISDIASICKPAPGDLFKVEKDGTVSYLLNIRAQCNLLHSKKLVFEGIA